MFLEFEFFFFFGGGGPLYKKYPKFDFWFLPLPGPGVPLGPCGASDQKLA